jgi:hypothetical protein
MKKQKKKNHSNLRLWAIAAIGILILTFLPYSAPCGAKIDVAVDETLNIGTGYPLERIESDYLMVQGTLNLYAGAYVGWGINALGGSVVNIYGGELGTTPSGDSFPISIFPAEANGMPDAVVTVYGTKFAVDGVDLPLGATEFTVDIFSGGVLTGTYGNNGGSINLKFFSGSITGIPIYLVNLDAEVVIIDIKPNSSPNTINLKSRGVVPVAVLTTSNFNVDTLDLGTVEFAGAKPVRTTLVDVNEDGDMDMLFHFKTQHLNLNEKSTKAELTGETTDEKQIKATDSVRIVPKKKK